MKILVIQQKMIGDVLVSTLLCNNLRKAYPNAQIDYMVYKSTLPVLQGNTSVDNQKSTIALGNGFVSNYSIEASVGGMPTANVTVDGLNLRSYTGTQELDVPAVQTNFGIPVTGKTFSLPSAISGVNEADEDINYGEEGQPDGQLNILQKGVLVLDDTNHMTKININYFLV